jgi:type IV pilus assembly protein PilA
MFCPLCGTTLADGVRFCAQCGEEFPPPSASSSALAGQAPVTAPIVAPTMSSKAIASLVLGLFSFIILAAIPAIVFGHIALSEIKKSAGRLQGRGMAIAGLVLGYLGIAVLPFTLIIVAIAIPNLLRARIAANEASAVNAVRTLNVAETIYAQAHRDYTCSLSDLRNVIGESLASGQKHGYVFELSGCAPAGGPSGKYQVAAYPMRENQSGVRAFCSDESGVIRTDGAGSAQGCLASGSPLE